MVQQQESSFLLPWLTAAMWLISYKVPPSSSSCKDFSRVWPQCLYSVPPSVQSPLAWIVCGKLAWLHSIQGVATAFHPGSSSCILAYNFYTVITWQNVNFPSFLYFYPQAFCHTLHEITKYTVLNLIITRLTYLIFTAKYAHNCNYFPVQIVQNLNYLVLLGPEYFLCNQHDQMIIRLQ